MRLINFLYGYSLAEFVLIHTVRLYTLIDTSASKCKQYLMVCLSIHMLYILYTYLCIAPYPDKKYNASYEDKKLYEYKCLKSTLVTIFPKLKYRMSDVELLLTLGSVTNGIFP